MTSCGKVQKHRQTLDTKLSMYLCILRKMQTEKAEKLQAGGQLQRPTQRPIIPVLVKWDLPAEQACHAKAARNPSADAGDGI